MLFVLYHFYHWNFILRSFVHKSWLVLHLHTHCYCTKFYSSLQTSSGLLLCLHVQLLISLLHSGLASCIQLLTEFSTVQFSTVMMYVAKPNTVQLQVILDWQHLWFSFSLVLFLLYWSTWKGNVCKNGKDMEAEMCSLEFLHILNWFSFVAKSLRHCTSSHLVCLLSNSLLPIIPSSDLLLDTYWYCSFLLYVYCRILLLSLELDYIY